MKKIRINTFGGLFFELTIKNIDDFCEEIENNKFLVIKSRDEFNDFTEDVIINTKNILYINVLKDEE